MVNDFLAGAIVMGFAIAALTFLKFWRRTREGLFLAFAGSFLLLGITQALLTLSSAAGRIPADPICHVVAEPAAPVLTDYMPDGGARHLMRHDMRPW